MGRYLSIDHIMTNTIGWFSFFVFTAAAVGVCHSAEVPAHRQVRSILGRFCVQCHNEKISEAGLRLDLFEENQWNYYELLDEIVARVKSGEMPPNDADAPLPPKERVALTSKLTARLVAIERSDLAGTYKKLAAREYSNALQDIFGAPVSALRDLPFDSEKDLKKLGEHQLITSFAAKQYYDVADDYLDRHIVVESPRVRELSYSQAETPKHWIHTSRFNKTLLGPIAGAGNAPTFMLRNPVEHCDEEGEYELTFDYRTFYLADRGRFDPAEHFEPGEVSRPPNIYVTGGVQVVSSTIPQKKSGTGNILCRLDRPIRLMLDSNRKFVTFRMLNNFGKTILDDPRFHEVANRDFANDKEKSAALKAITEKLKPEFKSASKLRLLVTNVSIRGPLGKKPSQTQNRIFGDIRRDDSFESCTPILQRYARLLFRRQVSDKQLGPYVELARVEHERTGNTFGAVKSALTAMLCSPHFVLKFEGDQEKLDDYMIAARLSFFLWNSTPDKELLALADAGELRDPETRREQALRLLADRVKSKRFTENFTRQWLGLRRFDQFAPNAAYVDPKQFEKLRPHIAQEPQQFFETVLYDNLGALNFIDSDFVVWNRALYSTYAKKETRIEYDRDLDGDVWQKMMLRENPDRVRGGLPSMGAIMSLTTDGENSQPILRGVWVARRMLGMEIKAPATVPAIEVNLENVSRPRDVLAKHKEDRSCYACHVKFDYLGLAMENYDVLGQFRTQYVHPVINDKGYSILVTKDPIDSLSKTPMGSPIPGMKGLKKHLLDRKDVFMLNLVETLFGYALGRKVMHRDRDQLNQLLVKSAKQNNRLQDLILDLVASKRFAER